MAKSVSRLAALRMALGRRQGGQAGPAAHLAGKMGVHQQLALLKLQLVLLLLLLLLHLLVH